MQRKRIKLNPAFIKKFWWLGIPIVGGLGVGAYFLFFKKTPLESGGGGGGGGGLPGGGSAALPRTPVAVGRRNITIPSVSPAPLPVAPPPVIYTNEPIIGNKYGTPKQDTSFYEGSIGGVVSTLPGDYLQQNLVCKNTYLDGMGYWWIGFEGTYLKNVMTKQIGIPPIIIPIPTVFPVSGWIRADYVLGTFKGGVVQK